jgi:hypothetical protein
MQTATKTLIEQIEDRIIYLSDYSVRWVGRVPHRGESDILFDGKGSHEVAAFTPEVEKWLIQFFFFATAADDPWGYGFGPIDYNDSCSRSRIIWMLQEALEMALEGESL